MPGSVAAVYKLSPRSTCFGGRWSSTAAARATTVKANGKTLGTVAYNKEHRRAHRRRRVHARRDGPASRAVAVDRNLNNVTLIPLDVATPAKPPAGAAPTADGEAGAHHALGPAARRARSSPAPSSATSFGKLVAAFFIAVAIVMLVARLFGLVAVRLGQPRVMGEVVAGIALGPTLLGAISPDLAGGALPERHPPASSGWRPTSG